MPIASGFMRRGHGDGPGPTGEVQETAQEIVRGERLARTPCGPI